MSDAINKINETLRDATDKAAKAQREAELLARFAPYIPDGVRHFYPGALYSNATDSVTATYKVRTIADLRALLAALPANVPCVMFSGAFAGIKPTDKFTNHDGRAQECDGLHVKVEQSATTGAYPCDEHAMGARWWSDTPAGRVSIRCDFHFNARADWPTIVCTYETLRDRNGNTKRGALLSYSLRAQPPHSETIKFASGDREKPGSYTVWWRDQDSRDLALEAME